MQQPEGASLALFLTVVGFCLAMLVGAVAWSAPSRRGREAVVAALAVAGWVGVTSLPVAAGWITPSAPLPGAPLMICLIFGTALGIIVSPLGGRMAGGLPLPFLVGIQGMRVPLEIVLHWWADEGVAPPQMTWTGQNVDILAGIVCLAVAPFAARSRAAAWASQVIGVVLLANVLRVVVLSLPTPMRAFEDPLLLPFGIPTLWIATVCVFTAVLFHGLTLRRLLQGYSSSA